MSKVNCKAFEPQVGYSWFPIQITGNFTYATVILIVDERTNQTITSTKTNQLPDGVAIPPTNAAGTYIDTVTYETAPGQKTTTVLAYPQAFEAPTLSYSWSGTLPTTNVAGTSVCSVAPGWQYITYSSVQMPAQPSPSPVDPSDPMGFNRALVPAVCHMPPPHNGDAAPVMCSTEAFCGPAGVATVQFLTETSVSRTSSNPTPTPVLPPANLPPPASPQPQQPSLNPPLTPNSAPSPNLSPSPDKAPSPNPAPAPEPGTSPNPASSNAAPVPNSRAPAPSPNQPAAPGSPGVTVSSAQSAPSPTPAPVLIGSQLAILNSSSNIVIDGQTVSQGSQVVVAGTTISLAAGGSMAIVNGASQAVIPAPVITVSNTPIVINGDGNSVASSGGSITTIGSITTDAVGSTVAIVGGTTKSLGRPSGGGIGGAVATGVELSSNAGILDLGIGLNLVVPCLVMFVL